MRPRFAGGGFAASVASLALGIFLLDRGTRTAKAKNAIKEMGAFFDATTKRIFEESGKGILASLQKTDIAHKNRKKGGGTGFSS